MDVNAAGAETQTLPGVGPVMAQNILTARTETTVQVGRRPRPRERHRPQDARQAPPVRRREVVRRIGKNCTTIAPTLSPYLVQPWCEQSALLTAYRPKTEYAFRMRRDVFARGEYSFGFGGFAGPGGPFAVALASPSRRR